MTDWQHQCVLCAARGKTTRLESGHCCTPCAGWLMTTVADIARLAADAAAFVAPGSSNGGGSRPVPGSRPPLTVDALDPENTCVTGYEATVLELCEAWERMIRSERGMAPYGPASAARVADGMYAGTSATLVGCVGFLGGQVAWMTTEPTFPLEDFADEMRACVRVLRRFDLARDNTTGYIVECPHDGGHGTCGKRIRVSGDDVEGYFTCPRCGTEWSVDRLMLVWAETSDAAMWLDAEAVTKRYGVDRSTLDKWVRSGRMEKWHGLYDVRPLALAQRRGA